MVKERFQKTEQSIWVKRATSKTFVCFLMRSKKKTLTKQQNEKSSNFLVGKTNFTFGAKKTKLKQSRNETRILMLPYSF